MQGNIRLSVITVNFNDAEGLARTLASSKAQSTREGWEHIVIDGGSADRSNEIISQYADILAYSVSERDGGIYQGMNKGIAAAQGEYCLFLNSGDSFASADVMEKALRLVTGDTDYYVGNIFREDRKGGILRSPRRLTAPYLVQRSLPHQAMFIRRSLLCERPYQTQYRIVADWEQQVWALVAKNATYKHIEMTVADFDIHGMSNTNQRQSEEERAAALSALFGHYTLEAFLGRNKYERRLLYLLAKDSPLAFHLKLIVLHIQWMIHDLFNSKQRQ